MDILLFFAIPLSTILLSIVWQRIVRSPALVAITAFAIFLVWVYSLDATLLIFAIAYTILAFITAILTRFVLDRFFANNDVQNLQVNRLHADNIDTDLINATSLQVENEEGNNDSNGSCGRLNRCWTRNRYHNFK